MYLDSPENVTKTVNMLFEQVKKPGQIIDNQKGILIHFIDENNASDYYNMLERSQELYWGVDNKEVIAFQQFKFRGFIPMLKIYICKTCLTFPDIIDTILLEREELRND